MDTRLRPSALGTLSNVSSPTIVLIVWRTVPLSSVYFIVCSCSFSSRRDCDQHETYRMHASAFFISSQRRQRAEFVPQPAWYAWI